MSQTTGMRLVDLIEGFDLVLAGDGSTRVTDLSDDSRTVARGSLFVARTGTQSDGRAFVADAVRRGAVAVVSDRSPTGSLESSVAWVIGRSIDQRLVGCLAERFWNKPSTELNLVGVTGTNGKTTTAFIIQHLLASADVPSGMIGTIVIDSGASRRASTLTTPGAIDFSRHLASMVHNGCQAAVAELSSHGIGQGRTAALDIDVAVFTNLTGDHLDYHGTMADYGAAKAALFERLDPEACAVVNIDDPYAPRMLANCRARVLRCGSSSDSDCRAEILVAGSDHSRVRFNGPWGSVEAQLPLIGHFNVSNALLSLGAAHQVVDLSRDLEHLRRALESCPPVPGRLERVVSSRDPAQGPVVLVDYAHTHDALRNVLNALRPLVPESGQLTVVFGCGGDRDRDKRPKMGALACDLADRILITSDNPRTEDPQTIIDGILSGVPCEARRRVQVEPDRRRAIRDAIRNASRHDVVVLAGKGHEDYQIIGTDKHRFDDRVHAEAVLQEQAADVLSKP